MSLEQELLTFHSKMMDKYVRLYTNKIIEEYSLPVEEKKKLLSLWGAISKGETKKNSYGKMSLPELKKLCKERRIKVSSRKKQEYIKALETFDIDNTNEAQEVQQQQQDEQVVVNEQEQEQQQQDEQVVVNEQEQEEQQQQQDEQVVVNEQEQEEQQQQQDEQVVQDEQQQQQQDEQVVVNEQEQEDQQQQQDEQVVVDEQEQEQEQQEDENFDKKGKEELYEICKARNLKVSQRMKKKELLAILKNKEVDLKRLNKDELKKIAKERKIKGISNKSREELLKLLGKEEEEKKEDNANPNEVSSNSDPVSLVNNFRQLEENSENLSIYDMTLEELQKLCKSRGMKTFKRRRNELIEWLEMNNENEEFDQYLTDNENVL